MRNIAGSPARSVQKPTKLPPASIPTVAVAAVAVDRFLRNAKPTVDRLAVDIDVAAVDRETTNELIPACPIEAVYWLTATLPLKFCLFTRMDAA
jgi:hypothetical protein